MSLPFYQEIDVILDPNGNGTFTFTPTPTYGTSSVTLTFQGGLTGSGFISINNNQLGPITLGQAFGPFHVFPSGVVKVDITGGPTNGRIVGVLQGACYLPSESLPSENLQFASPTVQNTTVLVYETDVDASSQIRFGPFSTAQFTALCLRVFGGPDMYSVGLDWFSDQEMTQETGSTEWVGSSVIEAVSDVWTNLGPWVHLTLTPKFSGCGTPPPWTLISLVPVASNAISLEHQSGLILTGDGSVADGDVFVVDSDIVCTGSAIFSIGIDVAVAWHADLFLINAAGGKFLIASLDSMQYPWGFLLPVALPGFPLEVIFHNNAGDGTILSPGVRIIRA